MSGQKGFSLVELIMIVAMVLIIAAIASPNLLRTRIVTSEASIFSSLRIINLAEVERPSHPPATEEPKRFGSPILSARRVSLSPPRHL
jgi:prepilin-type N-terminal cleavage/methylation domain-containing protein